MKLLIAVLFLCSFAFGQTQNTVYQKFPCTGNPVCGSFTTNAPGISGVIRNIGQQYHHLEVFTTGSCTSGGTVGSIFLEGSQDNVIWVGLGVPITNLTPGPIVSTYTYSGTTAVSNLYPYTRVNYLTNYNCPLTAYYTGTLSGTNIGSQPFTAISDGFQSVVGELTAASPATVATCARGTAMQLYAISLSAAGGANTVNVKIINTSIFTGFIAQMNIGLTATNPNWIQANGSRAAIIVPKPGALALMDVYNLIITPSAATALDYNLTYRCE